MARGNSALKAKIPKVSAGNKERALKVMMRVEGGQGEVLSDVDLHHWATVPASALPSTVDIVGDAAWIPRTVNGIEPGDDDVTLAFVLNSIGVIYERLLNPPPEIAGLVDPTKWTTRACASLKRAAGQSPRCALIEGDEGDPVCVVDYTGPAIDLHTGESIPGVTVFYPSICKYADPRARLTAEPNMAQEWVSQIHPAQAMRYGVNRILYRVRKDMLVEELRLKNRPLLFEWDPADIIPDLVAEPEDGPKRKYVWAGPVTITRPDGSTVTQEAEEGVLTRKQLIRTRQTEYLETGSKKLTRPAEDDALALIYMGELLAYVKEHDKPYRKSDVGKIPKTAAWLLFLNREDSLREVKELTEADLPKIMENAMASKTAKRKGLTQADIDLDPERLTRITTNGKGGFSKAYGRLEPYAIWAEWRDMFTDSPPDPKTIAKAQAALNEATNVYMAGLKAADGVAPVPYVPIPLEEALLRLKAHFNGE